MKGAAVIVAAEKLDLTYIHNLPIGILVYVLRFRSCLTLCLPSYTLQAVKSHDENALGTPRSLAPIGDSATTTSTECSELTSQNGVITITN